jgi:hypothetical protein
VHPLSHVSRTQKLPPFVTTQSAIPVIAPQFEYKVESNHRALSVAFDFGACYKPRLTMKHGINVITLMHARFAEISNG